MAAHIHLQDFPANGSRMLGQAALASELAQGYGGLGSTYLSAPLLRLEACIKTPGVPLAEPQEECCKFAGPLHLYTVKSCGEQEIGQRMPT